MHATARVTSALFLKKKTLGDALAKSRRKSINRVRTFINQKIRTTLYDGSFYFCAFASEISLSLLNFHFSRKHRVKLTDNQLLIIIIINYRCYRKEKKNLKKKKLRITHTLMSSPAAAAGSRHRENSCYHRRTTVFVLPMSIRTRRTRALPAIIIF